MIALVVAAATQASSGIVGYFQLGGGTNCSQECLIDAPNAFKHPVATAVNADGTGGASSGDLYALDRGNFSPNGRIQQFSASDQFIRLWGPGVVKSGPDQSNEVQAIRVDATGGTFKLGFGADTTAGIAANATAAQVEAALNGLGSIGSGGVSVSGGPGDAGGTTPYLVTFGGGSLAGTDQPLLKATDGSPPLSGAGATLSAYTTNQGAEGFEICRPAAGDECAVSHLSFPDDPGGGLIAPTDIAVDQTTGDLFVADDAGLRVNEFSATGHFIRAWGQDVVASGPDDSAAPDEQQSLTVKASGGSFTLGFAPAFTQAPPTTPPIPYNASAATVESALNALSTVGGAYGSVTVTGGPGDSSGSSPYVISFHGSLGGDDLAEVKATATGLTGAEKSATVETIADGGGFEVCEADDACKRGAETSLSGAAGFGFGQKGVGVAPAGAPNAGDVLITDTGGDRVEEFTPAGAFVRMFGWNVDETNPSSGFEVCSAESGDACKNGSPGAGLGQFAGERLRAVTEDSSGAIYTVEDGGGNGGEIGARVQKFTPAGGLDLTPSIFGADEVQALTVNASAGQFRLSFGAEVDGTEGKGDVTKGSTMITNVSTSKGEFAVGQPLDIAGSGLPFLKGESIVAVGASTLTVSQPIQYTEAGRGLRSNRPYQTPNLPFNVSEAALESSLNALPSIGAVGGSVTVSGGPGSAGGTTPYSISFDGGRLARTDPLPIRAVSVAPPLSGGSGPGANTAVVTTTTPGGPGGMDANSSPFDIAIGPADHVFVARYSPVAAASCVDGALSVPESRIDELSASGAVLGISDPCSGTPEFDQPSNNTPGLTVNPTTGRAYLNSGVRFESGKFVFGASPEFRVNVFGPPSLAPDLSLEPVSNVSASGATIAGTIDPNGPGTEYPDVTGTPSSYKTTYRIEYKKASDSTWTKYSPDTPIGSGSTAIPFSVGVGGLAAKTPYELKVVAVKPFTATVEETESFTTASAPPEIEALSSSNVTVDSADLHALINPQGTETGYHFEYGTTPAYGSETPETSIGEALSGQAIVDHIEGLQDSVYHFRVVATNAIGTTRSADQTFTFHPPVCPNQTVRQQTGAAYLPDCRAYELVSPEDAGGTTLFTGGPQSPYASNPPRLAFVGLFAAIPGSGRNPIDATGDLYVASRGAEGWHTRYVGPSSEEAGCAGGRPLVSGTGPPRTIQNDVIADPGLDRIIDWNLGNPLECYFGYFGGLRGSDLNTADVGSNAPYVWNANGDFLDRWPTAAADVPGSEANFACPQDPSIHPYPPGVFVNIPVSYFCSTYVDASKDLNHFVFSSQSGLYGEGGLAKAPGSAYDNDTAHNTLSLVSKLPSGEPIPQEPGAKAGPEELIHFPAVSADGSHILMGTATKPPCKQLDFPESREDPGHPLCPIVPQPTHLYMRVNDAVSYDVSAGKAVHYVSSTPDGTKVYFTSDERLTADDTDESTDLYMWSENGGAPTLTRISAGEPASAGNSDNCVATWTTDCAVKTYEDSRISAAEGNRGGLGSWYEITPNSGYTDNAIAAKSGDIYFYSPEQLVAGKGAPGKENVYAYHGGALRFVAALADQKYCIFTSVLRTTCSNDALGRLQVTPDGRYAAFITTSNVTAYDSHGHAEMYRYDADAEKVQCVSCRPDGAAPDGMVLGSEGGRFITDDGRVFFDTTEALDPRDTNARVGSEGQPEGSDVYEFVDGRPQLITSGTGTGRPPTRFAGQSIIGLYGVSADGVDAYFGTYDTLVGQDRNGSQLKFYDARTNGGFPFVPPPAPCAAADECHGPTSGAPAPIANGSGAGLGSGGNAHRAIKHHKRKHRKKRKGVPRGRSAHHKPGSGR